MKQCKICGKPFEPVNAQKYCLSCAKAVKKEQHKRYNAEYKAKLRVEKGLSPRPSRCAEIEAKARLIGQNYAELQKAKTIEMYARVVI